MENKYIETKVVAFDELSATEKSSLLSGGLDEDSASSCFFLVTKDKVGGQIYPVLPFEYKEMALVLQRLIHVMYELGVIAGKTEATQAHLLDLTSLSQRALDRQTPRRAE